MVRYLIDFFVRWFVAKTASWAGRLKHQSKNGVETYHLIPNFTYSGFVPFDSNYEFGHRCFSVFFCGPKISQTTTHTHTNKQTQL